MAEKRHAALRRRQTDSLRNQRRLITANLHVPSGLERLTVQGKAHGVQRELNHFELTVETGIRPRMVSTLSLVSQRVLVMRRAKNDSIVPSRPVLGIDPGLDGGIAIIRADGTA